MIKYAEEICKAIDEMRADLWDTNNLEEYPVDNHSKRLNKETARAEIWGAIMEYRSGELEFDDLLSFLQSFDRKVTPNDVYVVTRRGFDV